MNDSLHALGVLREFSSAGVKCQVTVKRDGDEVLDYILEVDRPLPSVIVLDGKFSQIENLEIVSRLRKQEKTRLVPVVILTTPEQDSAMMNVYELGVNSCVCKPTNDQEYLSLLAWVGYYWLSVNYIKPEPS